jgi:hypothetical protein
MNTDNLKINLNQNLWGLLLALISLGIAEYFKLCTLFWFGVVLSGIASVSFIVTILAYTLNYWNDKMKK